MHKLKKYWHSHGLERRAKCMCLYVGFPVTAVSAHGQPLPMYRQQPRKTGSWNRSQLSLRNLALRPRRTPDAGFSDSAFLA